MKMKEIKKRLYTLQNRLYLEAKYLMTYGFAQGTPIKYHISEDKKVITILPAEKGTVRKHVAATTQKTGAVVPVIDFRNKEIEAFFAFHGQTAEQAAQKKLVEMEVEFYEGRIVFTVTEEHKEQAAAEVADFAQAKEARSRVTTRQFAVPAADWAKAAGYEQLSLFDLFEASKADIKQSGKGSITDGLKQKALTMLSLFSGCGTMDKGFLDQGYDIVFANDQHEKKALQSNHIKTYIQNIGDHIISGDVLKFGKADIPKVDFVAAGIPCVKFSALNTKHNFRNSDSLTHPLVEKTLQIIRWAGARAFLIENVANFITVKGGAMLKRFQEVLPDFHITSAIIDATQLGSAQRRVRSFILGMKDAVPSLALPPLSEVRTVKQAFEGVEHAPQQDLFFTPTPKTLERMMHVPQGGNIHDVPAHMRAPKKKFSNYCQRLNENGHAPTITHVQDDVFIHPTEHRYLTVRETARLFSLPDDFLFTGSLTSIFEMLKNAVDYRVSSFLAKTIKQQWVAASPLMV